MKRLTRKLPTKNAPAKTRKNATLSRTMGRASNISASQGSTTPRSERAATNAMASIPICPS